MQLNFHSSIYFPNVDMDNFTFDKFKFFLVDRVCWFCEKHMLLLSRWLH